MPTGSVVKGESSTHDADESEQTATSSAFDAHAQSYAIAWDAHPLAQRQRQVVHDVLDELMPCPGRILDLGCGAGTDAARLTAKGHTVVGVDASAQMLERAREACPGATFHLGNLDGSVALPEGPFDLVLSNFGALNCVADLAPLAAQLRQRFPGVPILAVVMGQVCVSEILTLTLRGHPREAWRRFRATANVEGREIPIRYLAPRDLSLFGVVERVQGLGVLAPPPRLGGGRLSLFASRLDRWVGRVPILRHLGDHTLVVIRGAGVPSPPGSAR